MIFSKIKRDLSHLDLKLDFLVSYNGILGCGEKVYTKYKINEIKPYSLLTIKGYSYSSDEIGYLLVDADNRDHYLPTTLAYHYIGQDLKKQKLYDNIIGISLFLILLAVAVILTFNPEMSKYYSSRFQR